MSTTTKSTATITIPIWALGTRASKRGREHSNTHTEWGKGKRKLRKHLLCRDKGGKKKVVGFVIVCFLWLRDAEERTKREKREIWETVGVWVFLFAFGVGWVIFKIDPKEGGPETSGIEENKKAQERYRQRKITRTNVAIISFLLPFLIHS